MVYLLFLSASFQGLASFQRRLYWMGEWKPPFKEIDYNRFFHGKTSFALYKDKKNYIII